MYDDFIGDRISQLRIKKGVSARDMSLSLGQGVNYINTIENHKSLPSMTVFMYICEYLEISPKEFFDEENNNPKQIQDIVYELKHLNDEQLKSILTLIKNFTKNK